MARAWPNAHLIHTPVHASWLDQCEIYFSVVQRKEVVAMTCALPAEQDVPLSRWSSPDLARELAGRCQVAVSASSVRRWPADDALKPWQHRSWISVRDPDFEAKAARVLDLYAGIWDGQPLGPNDAARARPLRKRWIPGTTPLARGGGWFHGKRRAGQGTGLG